MNLYRKMGIHSRDELGGLVARWRAARGDDDAELNGL